MPTVTMSRVIARARITSPNGSNSGRRTLNFEAPGPTSQRASRSDPAVCREPSRRPAGSERDATSRCSVLKKLALIAAVLCRSGLTTLAAPC